ncbi:glycosyltransferase family 2 protein [Pseudohaliea rubra]|uniref:HlpA protein n=1 Tax=Pseudohaliea rubra DSM 19751 TaxID=1265313 RepID=A0A095XVU4_9GAMM|nr:glycosyltransferase family 2 protein [Pseudohaliea rubra]KGE03821.1 HlpA protein [Pseudohaliea rubra DSM 19751]
MTPTPIAYIVFNRPQHTEQTFQVLREQRPSQLFIIADGPRPGHPTDAERCAAVRAIVEQVDWPCEVQRNYAESNLGLKQRVSSGLDWVFEQVERAIVLEDDCVAHVDFFRFCETLLERYAEDERVAVVTGNNFQNGRRRGEASYYFSKYNHCWGWATWRRAWKHYQGELPFWPAWSASDAWPQYTPDKVERRYWEGIFKRVRAGQIDSWAYAWTGSVWYHGGLTATPNVNLVSNIGFGLDSMHTAAADSPHAAMATGALGDLIHPKAIAQDQAADRYVFDHTFGGRWQRLPWSLLRLPRRTGGYLYRHLKRSFA